VKKSSNAKYYLAVFAALLTLLVYLPALDNNFVVWDDGDYVTDNFHIRSLGAPFFKWSFSTFWTGNWHPLTWLSHCVDYAAWGLNPLGHHLTSIILHAFNTFLVVVLIIRLLDAYNTTQNSPLLPNRILDPSQPGAFNNLGLTYVWIGLFDKALEQFDKALLVDNNLGVAYYNRGRLYSKFGDTERASADYQKACDLGFENACRVLNQAAGAANFPQR
jgi:tetratricopeptide (TPR) repeat protein